MTQVPADRHTSPWAGAAGAAALGGAAGAGAAGAGGAGGSAFLAPPPGFRPSGTAPFFRPGQVILWRYRRPHGSGAVRPVRVVSDDADALVVWLAPQTEIVVAALPDGRPLRSVPASAMFVLGRSERRARWEGAGTLKVAPTGVPWSAWRFPGPGGDGWIWYANLEDPHCRDDAGILTQDQVLDVVVRPDASIAIKDADELAAAVAAGRFDAVDAVAIEAGADLVRAAVAAGVPPFDGSFDDWEPAPDWVPPALPPEFASLPFVAAHDPYAHLRTTVEGAATTRTVSHCSHAETFERPRR